MVSVWEGADAAENVAAYCELWDIEGPVLLDESAEYARQLGIRGVPTNVLVDGGGAVRAIGLSDPDVLTVEVESLIGDGRP